MPSFNTVTEIRTVTLNPKELLFAGSLIRGMGYGSCCYLFSPIKKNPRGLTEASYVHQTLTDRLVTIGTIGGVILGVGNFAFELMATKTLTKT